MAKGSAVREKIMEVASRLFYQQGFALTGINQIIAEADIAIGSLYNHFNSKTDLLLAYLEQEDLAWFTGFERFSTGAKSPVQKLLKICDYRIRLQEESGFAGCHFIKINAEIDKAATAVYELVEAHKEKQRKLIRELVKQTEIEAKDKNQLADTLFLLLEGGSTASTVYKSNWPLKQAKKAITALLQD
jgi:AcrR family transcriptional regulator